MTMTRVERRRARTRQRILDVALEAFADEGVDEVRLDHIADRVDIARGTLYSHFPSKDELIRATIAPCLEAAVEWLEGLPPMGPADGVRAILDVYCRLWRQHRDSLKVAHSATKVELGDLEVLKARFLDMVHERLHHANEAGLLRARDPGRAANLLSRVSVQLLELHDHLPEGEQVFQNAVSALLLREEQSSADLSP